MVCEIMAILRYQGFVFIQEVNVTMTRSKGQSVFVQWIPLLLDALRALGGSAESREAADWIANAVKLPSEEREKRNKNGILRFGP